MEDCGAAWGNNLAGRRPTSIEPVFTSTPPASTRASESRHEVLRNGSKELINVDEIHRFATAFELLLTICEEKQRMLKRNAKRVRISCQLASAISGMKVDDWQASGFDQQQAERLAEAFLEGIETGIEVLKGLWSGAAILEIQNISAGPNVPDAEIVA